VHIFLIFRLVPPKKHLPRERVSTGHQILLAGSPPRINCRTFRLSPAKEVRPEHYWPGAIQGDALTGPSWKKPSAVAIHCNHKERRIDSHMASASDAPMLTSRCPKSARLHGISVTYHSSEGANQLLPSGSALLVQTGTRKSARQQSLWVRSQGPISASNSGRGTHATMQVQNSAGLAGLFLSTYRCGITLLPYSGPCN
jgi:hypothetical protein